MSSCAGEKSLPNMSCAGKCALKHELMSTDHERDEWSSILPITISFARGK